MNQSAVVAADADDELAGEQTSLMCPNCGASLANLHQATLSIQVDSETGEPRQFSRFNLIRILGQGGYGTVWLAKDSQLEREVALKLPVGKRRDTASLLREAKTVAKLRHPNIVSVHEVGELDGQVYIVCEYIEGMDLRALLRKGLLPESQVIELIRAIAAGLHHAHEHQVVHRDVKPANVLVDKSGVPLVADFGLAKNVDVEESISSRGKIVGTILYMAPEQAGDDVQSVDRRADIYSVGVIMYEMLTGERPFRGDLRAIVRQKADEEPAPLRRLRPSIPLDLETICLKCLQRTPGRRYATSLELIEELDRYSRGVPILARPVSSIELAWRWCSRNRAVATLLFLLFLSLSVGLAGTTHYWLQARDRTEQTQRSLYASQMMLANHYLDSGEIDATRRTLNRFESPELQHLRGFEWHFLAANLNRLKRSFSHGKVIKDAAISREGDWIASISDDRALRVWNSQSGEQIREIPFKIGRWQSLSISPRDNQLAAGAKDGTVYVWRAVHDKSFPPRVIHHGPGVTIVRFSSDGKRLFSGGAKGAIRVWDTTSDKLIAEIPTGQDGLTDFDVSADGTTMITAGSEGTLRAWDVDTEKIRCVVRTGKPVQTVTIDPSAEYFYAGTYDSYLLGYQVSDGAEVMALDTRYDWISDIQFLEDSVLAICSSKGSVVFFSTDRQQELSWIQTHDGPDGLIRISSDGKRLIVGSTTGVVNLVDIAGHQQPTLMSRADTHVRDAQFISHDVVAASYGDGSVQRLDFRDQSFHEIRGATGRADAAICAIPSQSLMAVSMHDGSIEMLNADGNIVSTIPPISPGANVLRMGSDGSLLVVVKRIGPMKGFHVDVERDPVVQELFVVDQRTEASVRDVCVSADRQRIAIALDDNLVRFYDIDSQAWLPQQLQTESAPASIQFTAGDLVVGTRSGMLGRFDGTTLQPRWQAKAHVGHLNMVSVIPHGNAVATVGRDRDLRIWDLDNGDLRIRLLRHEHQVFSVFAANNGRTLLTGGLEGDVRLWRANRE